MTFERLSMGQKRDALVSHIESILSNDFGEEFVFHEFAQTQFLNIENRMERLELQENSNGKIRQCDVFWKGPNDGNDPDRNFSGLFMQDGTQKGSVQEFGIVIHYGVEYDSSGDISNRETFESLFESHSPKGLLVDLREMDYLKKTVGNKKRTMILSSPTNVVIPSTPRPLQSGGEEYAHYGEFRVFITDM